MSRVHRPVVLVGSVPGDNAEEVLRLCSCEIGNIVTSLSDGETGHRQQWVQFLAANIYHGHEGLETTQRPYTVDGQEKWHNESYGEKGWLFKVKEGVTELHFSSLGYAAAAKDSYEKFAKLKNEGVIPADVRFQVSLPLTESGTRIFVTNDADFQILSKAYEEAMIREIETLLQTIPAHDLLIQWDLALEVLFIVLEGKTPWSPSGSTRERYLASLARLSSHIPDDTLLGCHFCYGDLGHKHLVEPPNLELSVQLANESVKAVSRQIDYFHMPVPRNRTDENYFAPLSQLSIGDAKLFLGLIHYTDGVEGAMERVNAANKYYSNFGIGTECGFGRRGKDTIPGLLKIHADVANRLV